MAKFKDVITIFLYKYQSNFAKKFEDEVFILSLSYLANIFSQLNDLNMFMQGIYANNIVCAKKIDAFKKKLALLKRRVVENFSILEENLGH